ncbi:MAG TPA: TIGR03808 family TAT-translocated repetitive protein [Methyloceanibacter sp.]|nr:TIGR03808 family TAT-translocated repetitive protein [Methyloceanibacter sp.]
MRVGRRQVLLGGMGFGLAAAAGPRLAAARDETDGPQAFNTYGVVAGGGEIDQTATLQLAADAAAESGTPLFLPAGVYSTGRLTLKSGTQIEGVPGRTILRYRNGGAILSLDGVENVRLAGLVLDGEGKPLGDGGSLLAATATKHLDLTDCRFTGSSESGAVLRQVSGWIRNCELDEIRKGGLFSEDAAGLQITQNHVHDCGDNGIQIWRSEAGEDGTIVSGNRVERIAAKSGGSGEHGNGISVFRAGSVLINGNRIADCAYSAIRCNSGSNCQMIGNSCARLGEVALYVEFAFEGAVIANNLVDRAAMGVSVTNFNEGGRLAVVQGNLIRNLFQRKDGESRGMGIGVEADSVVTGNVVEGAPAYGILIGWGPFLRDVSVTGNLIRKSYIGIGVAIDPPAGTALISNNLISGAKDGAIRPMNGPTPVGPDLARESAEAYGNLAVYANVARS